MPGDPTMRMETMAGALAMVGAVAMAGTGAEAGVMLWMLKKKNKQKT